MPDAPPPDLMTLAEAARARVGGDPFGNPVLATSLSVLDAMDAGGLTLPALETAVRGLRDAALADRAARLARYVGGTDPEAAHGELQRLAARLLRPDPDDSPVPWARFRDEAERTRFAAVFTAHPTFALPPEIYAELADAASGRPPGACAISHRPPRPTLADEFEAAVAAIGRGRDALDALCGALLDAARPVWPDRWHALMPRPVILASWVGYDTDGRTDIGWWDTLRLRLRMKRLGLARLAAQVGAAGAACAPLVALGARVAEALEAVDAQLDAAPAGPDPDAVARFARLLVEGRERALTGPAGLLPLFEAAVAAADAPARRALCVARAGLVAHGLSLAHTHVRLNSAQLHNAMRMRLGLEDPPADPSRRRTLLAEANAALERVRPVPVDFGALLAEQSSAAALMMTVAQVLKHVDGSTPVRFLIAETESGYTLLAALWLARLFGVERQVEISPLFETADALEGGARLVEEALRSPHWRDYLRAQGRMCLQFGYSDSGRYVGQLAASYAIERLRLRVADALIRHELTDVEVVFFDTHGESIGRGAHPGSLADRLKYLSPSVSRQALAASGIRVREESAFQGGDGFLLFGTPELALATVTGLARHAFASVPRSTDPIYAAGDFGADFFASVSLSMRELVEDPGYAALLGSFGPALLDPTGSRPAARQSEGAGGRVAIRHPRELRAIPNNAILQQVGWCANTLHGLGAAAARQPEPFAELLEHSPRFGRAMDFARHALAHSDLDVLRATVALLDPGTWLDRAWAAVSGAPEEGAPGADAAPAPADMRFEARERAAALAEVAGALERLDQWAPARAMFRRVQADHLLLRAAWPQAPRMGARERLLHALRLALIQRIWLLGTRVPEFSPRHGTSRAGLLLMVLRLDVPAALSLLREVFPAAADAGARRDYGEPQGPAAPASYAREHAAILQPMERMFALVREVGTAITHENGAFG